MAEKEQRIIARKSWLYGQWVLQEAQAYHLPVLDVRPWDTLSERIKDGILLDIGQMFAL